MKTLIAPLAALFALAAPAASLQAAPALDPVPVIETWLLPRYDTLVATTAAQEAAWTGFCKAPSAGGVAALKAAFIPAANAWTAVEFVTMGPVSLALRADRFNFFPDRRNVIQRGMADVLASTDEGRFEPERFGKSNAAAQGLPALERLLYEPGAADALASGNEAAVRCTYGTAIAKNLATIAREVRTGWGDKTSGAFGAVVSGKGDPIYFPDAAAVPGMILTDLSGAYQRVSDTRILPVLGNGDPKPLLAEGWRAGPVGRGGEGDGDLRRRAVAGNRQAASQPHPVGREQGRHRRRQGRRRIPGRSRRGGRGERRRREDPGRAQGVQGRADHGLPPHRGLFRHFAGVQRTRRGLTP